MLKSSVPEQHIVLWSRFDANCYKTPNCIYNNAMNLKFALLKLIFLSMYFVGSAYGAEFSYYLGINTTSFDKKEGGGTSYYSYETGLNAVVDIYSGILLKTGLGVKTLKGQLIENSESLVPQIAYWDIPTLFLYKANDIFHVFAGLDFYYFLMQNKAATALSFDSFAYVYSFGLKANILAPHAFELIYSYDGSGLASGIDLGKCVSLRYVLNF